MLNDNFKIAINNSMFSGLATFSHTDLSMVSGSVNCSPLSDNTFGMVYKAATVNRTGYETYSETAHGGFFLALCSDNDLSDAQYRAENMIENIMCNNITLVKNNNLGATIISTLTNKKSEEIEIKSVYLCCRIKTNEIIVSDKFRSFYDAIFGKAMLENPIVMQPGEQRSFEYQIKF